MDFEVRQQIQRLAKNDKLLANELRKLLEERQKGGPAAFVEQSRQILAEMFRESTAYSQVMILAGYAGIFALWQLTNDLLTRDQRLITGCFLVASIALFGAYETYKMIYGAWYVRLLGRALDHLPVEQRVEAWRAGLVRDQSRELRIWIYFLVPTVFTGFGAAFLLLGLFVADLVTR